MPYTPTQVLNDLKKKKYEPIYFLQGEEPYYIDLIADYIVHNVLTVAEKSFNQTIVYGKESNMVDVLTHARRFPMGAKQQVVLVKEAQEMQDLKNTVGQQLLINYSQSVQPATLLVFAHKYKTIDARSRLGKVLAKETVLVNTKQLYDNQVSPWIHQLVTEKGLRITEKGVWMLHKFIGSDLARINKEIDKIATNLEAQGVIDDNVIQKYVGISRIFNAFELQKALIKKDYTKAIQIVTHFAGDPKNNPAIPIVALLFSFFSKLLLIHQEKDQSSYNIAKILRINPYFAGDYLTAIAHYDFPQVMKNIEYLHQADLQLKGIDYPPILPGNVLKELVFKLMYA